MATLPIIETVTPMYDTALTKDGGAGAHGGDGVDQGATAGGPVGVYERGPVHPGRYQAGRVAVDSPVGRLKLGF